MKNNFGKNINGFFGKHNCIIAIVILCTFLLQNICFAMSTSSIIKMTKDRNANGPSVDIYNRYPDTEIEKNKKYIQLQLKENIGEAKIKAIEDNVKLLQGTLSVAANNNIKEVLKPYCEDDTDVVLAYYLGSPNKKLFGRFYLQPDLTYEYSPVKGLTKKELCEKEIEFYSQRLEKVRDFFPKDYLKNFKMIVFDSDGQGKDIVKIYPLDVYGKEYGITIDINDMYKEPTFQRNLLKCFTEYLLKNESQRYIEDDEITEISQNVNDIQINIKKEKKNEEEKYFEYDGIKYKENSYIHLFYKNFWVNEEERRKAFEENVKNDEAQKNIYTINEKGNKRTSKDDSIIPGINKGLIYVHKDTDFFTEDAAKNLLEDFYETFKMFILKEKPAANYLKDKKVLFMYKFPEFLQIRNDLITKVMEIKN